MDTLEYKYLSDELEIQLWAAEKHKKMCEEWVIKTEKSITTIHDACVRKSDQDKNEIMKIALEILSDRNDELLQAEDAVNAIKYQLTRLK